MIELNKAKLWSAFVKLQISKAELSRRTGLNFRTINRVLSTGRLSSPSKLQPLASGLELEALELIKEKP